MKRAKILTQLMASTTILTRSLLPSQRAIETSPPGSKSTASTTTQKPRSLLLQGLPEAETFRRSSIANKSTITNTTTLRRPMKRKRMMLLSRKLKMKRFNRSRRREKLILWTHMSTLLMAFTMAQTARGTSIHRQARALLGESIITKRKKGVSSTMWMRNSMTLFTRNIPMPTKLIPLIQ